MNRSIGVFTQAVFRTVGSGTRLGGRKAQCSLYPAPSAIHLRSVSTSAGLSARPVSAGGIRSFSSRAVMRAMSSLASGRPGATGVNPWRAFSACSRMSSRSPALRVLASRP